jgi:hypothetical protein
MGAPYSHPMIQVLPPTPEDQQKTGTAAGVVTTTFPSADPPAWFPHHPENGAYTVVTEPTPGFVKPVILRSGLWVETGKGVYSPTFRSGFQHRCYPRANDFVNTVMYPSKPEWKDSFWRLSLWMRCLVQNPPPGVLDNMQDAPYRVHPGHHQRILKSPEMLEASKMWKDRKIMELNPKYRTPETDPDLWQQKEVERKRKLYEERLRLKEQSIRDAEEIKQEIAKAKAAKQAVAGEAPKEQASK